MTANILVVDDEPDLAPLIERRFRRDVRDGTYTFRFAADGEEALSMVHDQDDIDLILCDINMPNMDGLTLLRHLQGLNPLLKTVMVSAYGDMANIRTAMNRGAYDFVMKPIEFDDLRATIDKTLGEIATLRDAFERREAAERARFNLSRYFAPGIVDTLADTDEPFGSPREQSVAVLFADMVGFTAHSAALPPERVFDLLRAFHGRMAKAVFRANGSIDKYIGDGLMATFGIPEPGETDASNALACACDMVASVGDWNATRRVHDEFEVTIAIGVHYGPAMLGNIGDERRLEFATIGDTVNIASRLEGLARPLRASIVASDALIAAVKRETGGHAPELSDFSRVGPQSIRGQPQELVVWSLPHAA